MIKKTLPAEMAKAILRENKIEKPPINIVNIVKNRGIKLFKKDLPDDISGILNVEEDNNAKIYVNESHALVRRRFSIAHELGHYLLHRNVGVHIDKKSFSRDKNSTNALDPMEIEANRFAAEILMPKELIEKEISKYEDLIDIEDDAIIELSRKFKVSTTAMSIRFQSLGYSF